MTRIADAFTWPFRARLGRWAGGVIAVLLLPVAFIPLLGYAIAATRAAAEEPSQGPPPWPSVWRLLADGFWTALVVGLTLSPFTIAFIALAQVVSGIALVVAFFLLALPWGLTALLLLPHATASFATTGNPRALFDVRASLRGVRRDFAIWNIVVAAIVSGWAIGLACAGLLCVGIVPGIFYAILVSAHATAALARPRPDPSAR
ncbi:MAG TPA: DUF4013 domain-containing protein [Candidatus Dormibacteraeota bacterium]|nr:DUF4013 domain-containing protein [Candidatus Dormibacteraeota bacterium]